MTAGINPLELGLLYYLLPFAVLLLLLVWAVLVALWRWLCGTNDAQ
jgi:hypothetical protein